MKKKFTQMMPVVLAAALQAAPLLRTVLSIELKAIAPSAWAVVLRLAATTVGVFGFDAISSASSVAISPANATNGTPYVGTLTYTGGHSGSVSSIKYTTVGTCLGSSGASSSFVDGLTITYTGVNQASVTGTPTSAGTYSFTMGIYDSSTCGGLSDSRSASLVVSLLNGGNVAPSMVAAPASVTSQVGADVLFSAGASGTPTPVYYWYRGLPIAANQVGTNSSLTITNAQFANSGLFTVVASNVQGTASATAYLTVCKTAGTNILAFQYTNYCTVSNAITMTSFMTNVPSATNTYQWKYNYGTVLSAFSTNGSNYVLSANNATAAHSGVYTVGFNSVVGANTIVNNEFYDSYWAFGVPAVITASPQATNTLPGANVTLSATATVQQNPYGTGLAQGYLWYLNGTNLISNQLLTGSNLTSTLSLTNLVATNAGTYTVVVTNYWGSTTSSPAVISLGTPPSISSQPASKTVIVGQNPSFSVTASGTAPMAYQWQKNTTNLSNNSVYAGVNTNVLTLTAVTTNEAGSYTVVVTNSAGSLTSSPAVLTVATPPKITMSSYDPNTVVFGASSVSNLTYVIQSATNLLTPIPWTPVATSAVSSGGVLVFTNSLIGTQQFFRVLFP